MSKRLFEIEQQPKPDIYALVRWYKHEALMRQNEKVSTEVALEGLLDLKKINYSQFKKCVLKHKLNIGIYSNEKLTRQNNEDEWGWATCQYDEDKSENYYSFTMYKQFEYKYRHDNYNNHENEQLGELDAKTRYYDLNNISIGVDVYYDAYLIVFYNKELVANYRLSDDYNLEDYKPILIRLAKELGIDEGDIVECLNKYIEERNKYISEYNIYRKKQEEERRRQEEESRRQEQYYRQQYSNYSSINSPLDADKNKANFKKIYKVLAMYYHPDKPTGDTEMMKFINGLKQEWGL